MFHSAAIKLTTWYLAIVMVLSVGFSGIIYRLATDELRQNTNRQVYFFNSELPLADTNSYNRLRQAQLENSEKHLKADFVFFNLLVLISGGLASYALARRTLRPIEESHERQKRFASDASHELRTPLTAIQTQIEVALRDRKLSAQEARQLLISNLEEVAKLKSLSEALLLLDNQDTVEPSSPVSLLEISHAAIKRLDQVAKARKIKINNKVKPHLVKGDEKSLTELLVILVDNAIKYSPDNSQITLAGGKRNKTGYIAVTDQGIGIAAVELPRIFDRFYRSDSSRSKAKTEGYGLGLSIAKKIIDIHSGHIEVKSLAGQGSTFTIVLPTA